MIKDVIKKYPILRKMFLYGFIGAFSAGVDALIFALFRNLNMSLYIANFISINVGVACSFLLNTYINFKAIDRILKRAVIFWIVGYCGLGLSMLIIYLCVTRAGLNEMVIKFFSILFVAAIQFVLNNYITYKRGK